MPKTILRRKTESPAPPPPTVQGAEPALQRRFRPQPPHQAVRVAAAGKAFFVVYTPICTDVAGPFASLDEAIAAIRARESRHGTRMWCVRYGKEQPKGFTPELLQLHQAVEQIASRLGERKKVPVRTIRDIIQRFGVKFAEDLCEEAVTIHASTGLPIKNPAAYSGRDRRTLGGVFFFLSKQRVSFDEYKGVRSWAREHERWKEVCRGHDEWKQRHTREQIVDVPSLVPST